MKPRRSRFSRIYHRMTRRQTNRAAAWKQIGQLRPQGSLGHPAAIAEQTAYIPYEPAPETSYNPPYARGGETQFNVMGPAFDATFEPSRARDGHAMAVTVLSITLFLLACGYAALAGYTHLYNDTLACAAIFGAVATLSADALGISMAISSRRSRNGARLLGLALIMMTAGFGVLVAISASHPALR
jgi:hypothetical protein